MKFFFSMLSEEESNERFEDADENEDGRVTWEEYKVDSFGDDFDELNSKDSESDMVNFYNYYTNTFLSVILLHLLQFTLL